MLKCCAYAALIYSLLFSLVHLARCSIEEYTLLLGPKQSPSNFWRVHRRHCLLELDAKQTQTKGIMRKVQSNAKDNASRKTHERLVELGLVILDIFALALINLAVLVVEAIVQRLDDVLYLL